MRNLIKAERFKLRKSLGFKILLLGNIISTFIFIVLLILGSKTTGYQGMIISLSYVLHHVFMGFLFVAIFLCSEFNNRTFSMSLLCGHSRRKVFLAKSVVFLCGVLFLSCIYVGFSTVFAWVGNGFGKEWNLDNAKLVLQIWGCGLAGYITMGAVIILVATIARKMIVTIGVGVGLTYALIQSENLSRDNPLPFVKYTYSYQIRQIYFAGDDFAPEFFMVVMMITVIVALIAATLVFERTELK